MCFFQNIKRVTNLLDMSAIGTTPLLDTAKMPTCTYEIHSGSPTGPLLRYGKVGDHIYHVWQCDDEAQGFLVHSCWANDGRGFKFDFHDIDGCAVDPIIMGDVHYESSLRMAWVDTWGFKFSDTSVLNFQCVLELCKKAAGECDDLTPPKCGRGKRSVSKKDARKTEPDSDYLTENSFDIVTHMDVLDTFDQDLNMDPPPADLFYSNRTIGRDVLTRRGKFGETCVSNLSFGILLAIIVITFIVAVVTSSLLCTRLRPLSAKVV